MLTDIQLKFRECLMTFSSNSGNVYGHSVKIQEMFTDIQLKFRECLLTFS